MPYNIKPIPVVILLAIMGAISWSVPVLSASRNQPASATDVWGALPLNVQIRSAQFK